MATAAIPHRPLPNRPFTIRGGIGVPVVWTWDSVRYGGIRGETVAH